MSAKMKTFWTVFIEIGQRVAEGFLPGTSPWFCINSPNLPLSLSGRPLLKHLTFKTVFLLALGSGKRRSEIHAWLNKNIRHQADWSKVSLYPSPSFWAKNHLAKEGAECVAPVVIPALASTLDKSLKEDRSLCPVRALRYYLDKTQGYLSCYNFVVD